MASRLGELSAHVLAAVSIVVPGVGPALAAGPLAAELGEAAGHVAGSLTGVLRDAGIDEARALSWQDAVESGGVLLGVHAIGTRRACREALQQVPPDDLAETQWGLAGTCLPAVSSAAVISAEDAEPAADDRRRPVVERRERWEQGRRHRRPEMTGRMAVETGRFVGGLHTVAVFKDLDAAKAAVEALRAKGFAAESISVIAKPSEPLAAGAQASTRARRSR